MVPKPAVCKKPSSFLGIGAAQFAPTWETAAASVFGLVLAVPVPFLLVTLFRKTPIEMKMSLQEMRARLRSLQWWTCVGWILVIPGHLFCTYWLLLFASEFDTVVFAKWANASVQTFVHRFFSAPVLRA